MGQDGRCPFECVNFGHESAIDEASFVEDLITTPIWICTAHSITDCIVLHRKERMQHLQSDPPIIVESRERVSVSVARKELLTAFLGEQQLAVTVHVSQSP